MKVKFDKTTKVYPQTEQEKVFIDLLMGKGGRAIFKLMTDADGQYIQSQVLHKNEFAEDIKYTVECDQAKFICDRCELVDYIMNKHYTNIRISPICNIQ